MGDVYRVILSSGEDSFFATSDIDVILNHEIEIVEIDLERISGTNPTSMRTLGKIAEGIARCFEQNEKAVLYYFCDDMNEIPAIGRGKGSMWPQEYRSALFSRMFQRQVTHSSPSDDIVDVAMVINQGDRPLYMHLIARVRHSKYIDKIKEYISDNYANKKYCGQWGLFSPSSTFDFITSNHFSITLTPRVV